MAANSGQWQFRECDRVAEVKFCLGLGGGGYVLAAQWTNHDTAVWSERLGGGSWWRRGKDQPGDKEMARAKTLDAAKVRESPCSINVADKPGSTTGGQHPPQYIVLLTTSFAGPHTPDLRRLDRMAAQHSPFAARADGNCRRDGLDLPGVEGQTMGTVHAKVVLAQAGHPRRWAKEGMGQYRHPLHEHCVLLLLANHVDAHQQISHQSLPHLAFNSLALVSFGSAAYAYLASPVPTGSIPSSTHTPHFLAFLLAAGLFSSLSSHLWTNIFRLPRLLSTLASPVRLSSAQALAAHQSILPSLGASGAIYAALTVTALAYPEARVSLIFLPFFSMTIGPSVAVMVLVDAVGLVRGWRMFDHVAHLGGALFGVIYYRFGREWWTWLRRQLGARDPTAAHR